MKHYVGGLFTVYAKCKRLDIHPVSCCVEQVRVLAFSYIFVVVNTKNYDMKIDLNEQGYEMFLRHHVGGPHTIYAKCKRLNIHPLVCNIEQVILKQIL